MVPRESPDRNLALDLARVTEAAALAAGRWMGRGNKEGADQAAVDAMRIILSSMNIDGIIVIGEGEKDKAPMLYNGEEVGKGVGPALDLAVDPIDGTRLTAEGGPGAIAVIAASERGTMFSPGHIVYMDKIAVGPKSKGTIDITAPVEENLKNVAKARNKDVDDLTVVILDRPRHTELIKRVRKSGARIRLIRDGDVAAAIAAALPDTGIDILMGIGGSPEAVITAAALKCIDGDMQAMLWPRNDEERAYAREVGMDLNKVLTLDDLVASDNVFFAATGITDGELLKGVRYYGYGAATYTLAMRSKSGTIRWIESHHHWEKLMRYSAIPFDLQQSPKPLIVKK